MFWGKRKKLEEQEKRRVRRCNEALEAVGVSLGYIARRITTRNELQSLIDEGIESDDLFWYVVDKIEKASGTTLGYHLFDENVPKINVKLLPEFRDKHIYIIGKTGSGKTNLLRNLISQDLEKGNGFGVISPELELLTEEILPYIPEERINDVIYVNPADKEKPVTFNPLEMENGEDIDRKTDDLLVIFQRALGEAGAQMLPILRNSFYALCERDGTTLLDMYKLLSRQDPSFRDEVIKTTQNPTVARFFQEDYPLMRQTAHLPITNRLDSFVGVKIIRNTLCSSKSSFSFREAMDEGKILLFNLSDGILGQENSQLMGQLVVSKFQQALMSRASIPKKQRRSFTLYIDEFQTFTQAASESYEKILSRARKYKMVLVLAHQQTKQIPDHLLREILGNVGTIISFNVSQFDAQKISKEFIDENIFGEITKLEPEELLTLETGEAFCKIGKNFFKMKTYLADQYPDFNRAEQVIESSKRNYGIKPVSEIFRQKVKTYSQQTQEEGYFE